MQSSPLIPDGELALYFRRCDVVKNVVGKFYSFNNQIERFGGGIIIFIRDTISSKILGKHIFPNDVESIFVELNFRKCKWLLCGTYHPPPQSDEYFFSNLSKALDTYSKYGKVLLVENFNTEISE